MSEEKELKPDAKAGDAAGENGEALREKLAACEKEKEEYLAGWKRAKADFINYKKEEVRRMEELAKYANEAFMKDMIGVLDHFDLGLRALEKAGPVDRGVYMIRAQLADILEKRGLTQIPSSPGRKFDPAVAEVIAEVESDSPPGTVVEEIEPGYRLHDKIVRPARVKVSKGKASNG